MPYTSIHCDQYLHNHPQLTTIATRDTKRSPRPTSLKQRPIATRQNNRGAGACDQRWSNHRDGREEISPGPRVATGLRDLEVLPPKSSPDAIPAVAC
ncbi:hypothetical protein EYC84_009173 [Monilinia fructicola]|uniref:Uncharacterized protein n=1 Tax=Monilinia fructicola TaxID=38448 RepID=A0A5M9JFN0_MONFR|nr:hypothetical protein EYC84_009173 [Monilinia fructicola]